MSLNSLNAKIIDHYFVARKIPHAFLFKAFPKISLDQDVLYLINSLNGWKLNSLEGHLPYDLIVLNGLEQVVDKEVLAQAIYQLSSSTLEADKKILVIKNLEKIHPNSLNALLKYIEEPFANTYIILTTNLIDKVLPTIQSRCQILNVTNNAIIDSGNLKPEQFDLLSSITSSQSEFDAAVPNFLSFLEELNSELKNALENPHGFKLFLDRSINPDNAFLFLNIFRHLLSLVLTQDFQKTLFFSHKVFEKYTLSKCDFVKVLELINIFFKDLTTNTNFFLLKENFLINLVTIYEQ